MIKTNQLAITKEVGNNILIYNYRILDIFTAVCPRMTVHNNLNERKTIKIAKHTF